MANYDGYIGSGSVVDVVFMTCIDHGKAAGHLDYRLCQPQIVPIFGTFYAENEPDKGGEDSGVSFNKVIYGGRLIYNDLYLASGEITAFEFELFKLVEGEKDQLIGVYPTDQSGVVFAEKPSPGNYVFREVPSATQTDPINGAYWYPWGAIYPNDADGLYFTIALNGDVTWRDFSGQGSPVVDNKYYCKHYHVWSELIDELWYYQEQEALGNGKLVTINGVLGWLKYGDCTGTHYFEHVEWDEIELKGSYGPTCTTPGKFVVECCGTGIDIIYGEPTGHLHTSGPLEEYGGREWCYDCGRFIED